MLADSEREHPLAARAGAKPAGALNGTEWPPERMFCADTIVRLKRARVYLDDALRATESCPEQKLIEPVRLGPILVDLIDPAHEADELIDEPREQLKPADEQARRLDVSDSFQVLLATLLVDVHQGAFPQPGVAS